VQSVLAQTFTDFELIVVDDGSSDNGANVVEEFDDSRVRLTHQETKALARRVIVASQRPAAIWLRFSTLTMNGCPRFFPRVFVCSTPNPVPQRWSRVTSSFRRTFSREDMWHARGLVDGVARLDRHSDPRFAMALLAYMTPCTTVGRAEIVRKLGGFYERGRCVYGEDAHLWLKLLFNEGVVVNLKPLARIHFEASGATQTRRSVRPIEPFLIDPREIQASCPQHLRSLLARVLAIRAFKTACMLGYWGRWREARELVARFRTRRAWQLPYYTSSLVCRTPIAAVIGKVWRTATSVG
jgi:hypothetical protein